METLRSFLELVRDPRQLIEWGGYIGLTLIIFMETGLLVGFFLPGDSLLVTAGLLAATGVVHLNLFVLMLLLVPAAIIGDAAGYWIGRRAGRALYQREDSRFFKRKHLLQTHAFYERHGGKTIVMARFVPIVRTFAPVVAGVAEMSYRHFASFNIFGGIGWVISMLCIGYFLGTAMPGLAQHIELLAVVIIAISLIPLGIEYLRHRRAGEEPAEAAAESAAGLSKEV
ncbi:MAG TPA: VTT domain-containing protein [Herpetosiphonaceae bacterium]|nr:VTT domain-containing protein [Herpetosiphonaceae bacterium]